jgi:hypothetical protein
MLFKADISLLIILKNVFTTFFIINIFFELKYSG